jgi:hypothetical protein
MCRTRFLVWATVLLTCAAARDAVSASITHDAPAPTSARSTLYGVSPFPYGPTATAAAQTFGLSATLGDLYVVQLDDGIPWREALANADFPTETTNKWEELRSHAPQGRPVYLALEPLGADRVSLAPASKGSSVPSQLRGAAFDNPALINAYTNYVRRAVQFFRPSYLNLGVENGEMAQRDPAHWPAYVTMVEAAMAALRADAPALPMGISFGLQSLMTPATANRARALIDASDYVGLSFYPYMSAFHQAFGEGPLPAPPDQWRGPLDWVRSFTSKPIAICETGYNTAAVTISGWQLSLQGSPQLQSSYLGELAGYADRDKYLFVVYYFPVDIGPLLDSLPPNKSVEGSMWRQNGLLDAQLNPKPALAVWNSIMAAPYQPLMAATSMNARIAPGAGALNTAPGAKSGAASETGSGVAPAGAAVEARAVEIGFRQDRDLCQALQPSQVRLVDADRGGKAMLWEYQPHQGSWSWCARSFVAGLPSGVGMRFRIRSDVAGPIILELKGRGGQGYFAVIQASQDWQDVVLRWRDFLAEHQADHRSPHSDQLAPGEIADVVWADEGRETQLRRQTRHVWVADWIVQ